MEKLARLTMKSSKKVDMLAFEKQYYSQGYKTIAGVDEVGRGCWAGPVVAAAVIFPRDYVNTSIKDSKVLSKEKRELLNKVIRENALAYAIGFVDAPRIDKINIKAAAQEAMLQAINRLSIKPDCILVDAEPIKVEKTFVKPIIKGDAKSTSIAAASIIAKVYRDKLCDDLDKQYPQYGFAKNKGYGTIVHVNALKQYGPIAAVHRMSYKPVKANIK